MSSIVDAMRASRKNPSVLKLKVLKVVGEDPDVLIFIYEGPDDVPVYEEWMRRIANCPRFEPLAGSGKQQLIAYHALLLENADPLLDKVFFFVDRDFDLPIDPVKNIFELESYSIENLLCTEEVLDSILRDEFRRAGELAERAKIKGKFVELQMKFYECCSPINFALFVAQRKSLQVVRKPERVSEIVHISVNSIVEAYGHVNNVISIDGEVSAEELTMLELEFNQLPLFLRQRGKYILEMFRRWLRALAEDIKCVSPVLFRSRNERLPGDPSAVPLRRLAASAHLPRGLSEFVEKSVLLR
ncbi:hypothetical protein BLA6860_02661 [Burkholderia lata]|uniref:DUF4435 domain-containing protein n=1 Tax=Burkholderia lata (strain ATCC 17760 / DSM 23089 / LMG 22485 / NCIMB 9086 / R18194 / 383) TaxID=482957 RepID=UPI001454359D|nr:DUF4435 domain-containing protein [Burkholderia lata]VWB57541.1 hypothetical protein BLA6860_02661 [Burkholderia lata]